ncbi:MAG: hypothetical protein DRP70_05055 [Spirochaetes bacterium]|nr:MAG: hypothetical protein DRP70_05055 [Spirochaetota bacterium]RKX95456.1 MAG: hypothetical protein DRZ90_10260 [Spirochaetota bacterium]
MKMLNEKSTSLIRVLISLVLSYLALVSGLKDIASLSVPDTWIRDFLILLGLSALTSLGLVAVKKTSMILLLLAIRFITIVLIGIPFGELLSTDFVLLTALILDITFSLPLKPALAVLVLGIPVCLVSQMDFSVYYFKAGTPSEVALYAYGSWAVVFSIFGMYINSLRAQFYLKINESDHRKLVIEELVGANRGYLEYATAVELETSEKERKRIITELHDVVGQSFTNILAITDMAEKHPPDSEELEDLFSVVRSQARYGLDETRAVLYKLHTFKPIVAIGLRDLNRLIAVFSRSTHMKVDVNWANLPWDLGTEYNDTVFKVIRESLINSFRHGKATQISIHFRIDNNVLFIDITDNGQGAKSIKKGIGLSTMEERVARVKGTIDFKSGEREFSVHVRLPLIGE